MTTAMNVFKWLVAPALLAALISVLISIWVGAEGAVPALLAGAAMCLGILSGLTKFYKEQSNDW